MIIALPDTQEKNNALKVFLSSLRIDFREENSDEKKSFKQFKGILKSTPENLIENEANKNLH